MSDESVKRLRATMIKKFGSEEYWHEFMRQQAIKGGRKSKRHLDHETARKIGKLGGLAKNRR